MKRIFEIIASIALLLILSPVILITGLLVRIFLGSPIIFFQIRPGKDCKPFKLLKFRTMTNEHNEEGNLLPNEMRKTKFGKLLRSTSLDELPELINIIKGDMSFVGPRPLRMEYIQHYTGNQIRRHEVKPGITGWAQVNGRNAISFTERFKMDIWYVDNKSFLLNMKILFLTVIKVLKRENTEGELLNNKPFDGTN
ncbi:MAG: sugar transferase [Ferruginibacter sp.]